MPSVTSLEGSSVPVKKSILDLFTDVRSRTVNICSGLQTEDYVVQPVSDVSPPKWHLAHTTWFFETFILKEALDGYREFDTDFGFLFNSYYETVGERVIRSNRGNITRPGVDRIMAYRAHVDENMAKLMDIDSFSDEMRMRTELGLNHEMQHQELLYTDIKYILGHNPLFPPLHESVNVDQVELAKEKGTVKIPEGIYKIGFDGDGFHFDNERNPHRVFLESFEIDKLPVTAGEYLEFMESGGYGDFRFWHADAWDWVNANGVDSPLYFHKVDGKWKRYTLAGLKDVKLDEALVHVSYYEAAAFANWKGRRLPTEFEWEVASDQIRWGFCWEWTNSAYLPYPGFKTADGALGEYNGKFMVNQMVLRGASPATYSNHSRHTYRNFFHPHLQWQFSGFRLANNI
ncbi:MAG: ergothioneine biosynthesis protein EgtB [Cryomorphaceae bacterium]|nr:ergothioneine biosynthesis protein EgtB [Flavobacteriales bacterium]